eukprot:s272_g15.t1
MLRFVRLCILFFVSPLYTLDVFLVSLHKIENLFEISDWWIYESLFSGTRDTFKTSSRPFTHHQMWEAWNSTDLLMMKAPAERREAHSQIGGESSDSICSLIMIQARVADDLAEIEEIQAAVACETSAGPSNISNRTVVTPLPLRRGGPPRTLPRIAGIAACYFDLGTCCLSADSMFVPTSYSLGVVMALCALVCWGSWSVTLVLATSKAAMPFQLYYTNFTLSFLVTGFVVGLLGGSLGSGGEMYDFHTAFLEEITGTGHSGECYVWGMLGGVVWNLANILLCKGISMMGNAIGFPLCVGLGMVTGAIVAYVQDPKSNLTFLVPGVIVALMGICTVGFLSYRKDKEVEFRRQASGTSDESSEAESGETSGTADSGPEQIDVEVPAKAAKAPGMIRKLVVCILGGLLLGFSNIGIGKATSEPCLLSPYANQFHFSVGVFITSLVMLPIITSFPIEGGESSQIARVFRGYRQVELRQHLLAILGGFILCMGFFFFNLGNKSMNLTVSYCIGQSAPLVGILWGTFFFKEFAGTSEKVWGLVPVVCLLFAGAIVLIAAAG